MWDSDYFQSISTTDYSCNSTQEETLTAEKQENMMVREIKLDIFPPDESYDKHTAPPLENGKLFENIKFLLYIEVFSP